MRFWLNIMIAVPLALAAPAGLAAQSRDGVPACRGSLDGNHLTTTIEFDGGYAVEAPWQVTWNRSAALEDGRTGMIATASLDRIVESNTRTGERSETAFPEPIVTTFEGATEEELVYRAAQVWCLTVMKAQQETRSSGTHQQQPERPTPTRTVGP